MALRICFILDDDYYDYIRYMQHFYPYSCEVRFDVAYWNVHIGAHYLLFQSSIISLYD